MLWEVRAQPIARSASDLYPVYKWYLDGLIAFTLFFWLNAVAGKATLVNYNEMSLEQEPIPAECFYTRRAYNSLFGSLKVCMVLTSIHLYDA